MKIKRTPLSKKTILIIVYFVLIAIGCSAYALLNSSLNEISNSDKSVTENSSEPSSVSTDATENDTSSTNTETKTPTQYTDENGEDSTTTSSDTINMVISAIQDGTVVRINTSINEVWSAGSCTLTINNDSKTASQVVELQAMPSYTTCKGFTVQTSELGAGTWQISVSASHDSQKASATKELTVK